LPGELVFIGLGLHDEYGISLRGQAEAKSCDHLFAEFYTSTMPGLQLANLKRLLGRNVEVLSRKEVEENAEKLIVAKAQSLKVGFLVPGDPMVATTHVDLRLRAHKAGVRTSIVHAASVISAASGATGLQSYKFGRTVTIPATWQGGLPESIYTGIKSNLASGLHSLVLLEIDVENNKYISIPVALKQLLSYSERTRENAIKAETLAIGIARLEAPDMTVKAGKVSELANWDFGEPPYVLIFPGPLHFVEAEALQTFCGAPRELVNPK
jgi:diphthine synthase